MRLCYSFKELLKFYNIEYEIENNNILLTDELIKTICKVVSVIPQTVKLWHRGKNPSIRYFKKKD